VLATNPIRAHEDIPRKEGSDRQQSLTRTEETEINLDPLSQADDQFESSWILKASTILR
jgi:hypothetical protein